MKKKILTFVLAIVLFIPIMNVKADTITAEAVANKMKQVLPEMEEASKQFTDIIKAMAEGMMGEENPELVSGLESMAQIFDSSKYEITSTENQITIKNNGLNLQSNINITNSVFEYGYEGNRTEIDRNEFYYNLIVDYLLMIQYMN